MKSIYILLTRSETYVSKLIHLTTSDPFTHVSISFDRSLQPLYGFARKTPRRALPAGLRTEPLNEGYYRQHRDIPCAVYEFQVSDDVYWRAKRLVDEMMENADWYRYNVLGLFLCAMNIPLSRKRYFFCAEFVGYILQHSQAVMLPKEASLMHPTDYALMPGGHCIFQGTIRDLVARRSPPVGAIRFRRPVKATPRNSRLAP